MGHGQSCPSTQCQTTRRAGGGSCDVRVRCAVAILALSLVLVLLSTKKNQAKTEDSGGERDKGKQERQPSELLHVGHQ